MKFIISKFERANLQFQCEVSKIHRQQNLTLQFVKELQCLFVKPCIIRKRLCTEVDYKTSVNLLSNSKMCAGQDLRDYLDHCQLSPDDENVFFKHVKEFLKTSVKYLIENLPHDSLFLKHIMVADTFQQGKWSGKTSIILSSASQQYFHLAAAQILCRKNSTNSKQRIYHKKVALHLVRNCQWTSSGKKLSALRDDCNVCFFKFLNAISHLN